MGDRRRKERRRRPRYIGDSHGTEESSVTLGSESDADTQERKESGSDGSESTDEGKPGSPDIESLLGSTDGEAENGDTEIEMINIFTLPIRPARPETPSRITETFIKECSRIPGEEMESCLCHELPLCPIELGEVSPPPTPTPCPGPNRDGKRKADTTTGTATPSTRDPVKRVKGQP